MLSRHTMKKAEYFINITKTKRDNSDNKMLTYTTRHGKFKKKTQTQTLCSSPDFPSPFAGSVQNL